MKYLRGNSQEKTTEKIYSVKKFGNKISIIQEEEIENKNDMNPTQSSPLIISLANGDMMFSKYPVMMGHFEFDGIFSAERVANKYMENTLSKMHSLDIYPGAIGSNEIFINQQDNPFKGAIIVGLGSAELINAYQLALTVEKAVMKYLLDYSIYFDRLKDRENKIGITSLFIAADYGGVSVDNCCRAILQGVVSANNKIMTTHNNPELQVQEVEFLEIFEDKAISGYYSLDSLVRKNSDGLNIAFPEGRINQLPGILKRLLTGDSLNWWQRLSVQTTTEECAPDDRRFTFFSSTNNAREEKQNIYTSISDIENLIQEISVQKMWSYEKAKTIFEMAIPAEFKESIKRNSPIVWVLDTHSATIPWELLQTGSAREKPLCVSAGMIRQLSISDYTPVVSTVHSDEILIIGDPDLNGLTNVGQLNGAVIEAKAVFEILKENEKFIVGAPLIQASAAEIQIAFFSKYYRMIHFAGHGVFDPSNPDNTGLIIGANTDLSQPILFTPAKFKQFAHIPELVFINACYAGAVDTNAEEIVYHKNKLAANIGTQLISMGVKAVVLAGWEVEDEPAALFARTFYTEMSSGTNFGDAVLKARQVVYDKFRDTNTWGAYQCYGQPHYQLTSAPASTLSEDKYKIAQEAENDLNNLLSGIDIAFRTDTELLGELERITRRIRKSGITDPVILEKEAQAYLGLDENEKALELYKNILSGEMATYKVWSLEKFQDITIKNAVNNYLKITQEQPANHANHKEIKDLIAQAMKNLNYLLQMGRSGNRTLMVASAYKRLALISGGLERLKYLIESRDEYKAAYDLLQSSYALQNWITMELLLYYANRQESLKEYLHQHNIEFYTDKIKMKADFKKMITKAGQRQNKLRKNVSFWSEADSMSLRLSEYILKADDFKKSRIDYLDGMKLLWKKSVSKNKKSRQIDNLIILKTILADYGKPEFSQKLENIISELKVNR